MIQESDLRVVLNGVDELNVWFAQVKYREFQTAVKRLLRKQVHDAAQSGDAAVS